MKKCKEMDKIEKMIDEKPFGCTHKELIDAWLHLNKCQQCKKTIAKLKEQLFAGD